MKGRVVSRRMTGKRFAGFSLIEILMVAAIVSILASIAIPRLQQYKERAMYSRVLAEQKMLADALDAYQFDHGKYPLSEETPWEYPNSPFNGIGRGYFAYVGRLTTPAAYIKQIPEDPWSRARKVYDIPAGEFGWEFMEYWSTSHARFQDFPYPLQSVDEIQYVLFSWGPDGDFDHLGNADAVYDPTNGIGSSGDVILAGPR